MNVNLALIVFTYAISVEGLKDDTSLRSVLIIFRHGARTPLQGYENDPHKKWAEGWGKLTLEGKNQMYSLGKKLRNTYSEFLSEYYIEDEVYVRSSDRVRCKMSAQLVLAGLFPPKGYQVWNPSLLRQPIPVSYVPFDEDNLLSMNKPCPAFSDALKQVLLSEKIYNHSIAHKELYEYLTLHTGQNVKDIFEIHKLYDTLTIEKHHNLKLPAWTEKIQWDVMYEIAALKLFLYTMTPLTQRLLGGTLLQDIVTKFNQRSLNETNLKLVLYSAHDSTLVTALQTLGFDKLFLPEYGAHLIFELHQIDNEHEIKILFGKNFSSSLAPLELSFCPSPCKLKEFEQQLQLKSLFPNDWDQECAKK